jgi:hypothetical protein
VIVHDVPVLIALTPYRMPPPELSMVAVPVVLNGV